MKILYLARLPILDSALGVIKKISGQVESLKYIGVEVDVVIFFKDDSKFINCNEFPKYFKFIKYPYSGIKRPIQLLSLWNSMSDLVQKSKYDLVYFRYPGSSYFLYNLLKNNINKIILEHNTKELLEIKLNSKRVMFDLWQEKYFAKKSFKFVLGNVGKSSDFAAHQEFKAGYKLNLKTITNGVNVNAFQKREVTENKAKGVISLIFVGNISIWHGLDRLFVGIKNNKSNIKYKLYLVGKKEIFLDLIKQFGLNNLLNDKIILTGFKSGNELNELFNNSDFAIGSLGLHRLEIVNGVPLKHREYLSRGIPFIYSGKDEDINSDINSFLYNIKPDETAIDFNELLKFISSIAHNKDSISEQLINYAYKTVDIKIKALELSSYFKERLNYKNLNESN